MRLTVQSWGEFEKPSLLFLHGFMGAAANWQRIAEQLSADYFCVAVDLPGHGKSLSNDSDQFTMPHAALAVVETIGQIGLHQPTLVGYSMGGRLALYLAVHFPQLFCQLVLESALPGIDSAEKRHQRQLWDEKIARQLETQPLPDFLTSWYQMPLFATLRRHPHYEQAVASRLENDPAQLALSMRQMGTGSQPSLWKEWADLNLNSHLIVGELDQKYVAVAAEMKQKNPRTTVQTIAQTGHNTHFESPANYLHTLRQILQP